MKQAISNIVSVNWLKERLEDDDLVILDATMKKKPNGEAIAEPEQKICNAQAFDFDTQICDQNTDLPHMLCSEEQFTLACQSLGINQNSRIVIYDAMGIFSSPRVWWMFKVMGHQSVFVLDGGLPKWIENSFPSTSNYDKRSTKGNFSAKLNSNKIFSSQQVLEQIDDQKIQLLDARSHARFTAKEAEPRIELKAGHIPNSSCLPFTELLENGVFKSTKQLGDIFKNKVKPSAEKQIFSCGSGVTACILALAADECGYQNTAVYDGSWSEWGMGDRFPVD